MQYKRSDSPALSKPSVLSLCLIISLIERTWASESDYCVPASHGAHSGQVSPYLFMKTGMDVTNMK